MHVKPVRYQNQGCVHFITFSCYRRMPLLDSLTAKETFERTLEGSPRLVPGLSRSSRNGPRGGENRWVSCSWREPTLPQKAREGWGNLARSLDSERMGQPPGQDLVLRMKRGPFS